MRLLLQVSQSLKKNLMKYQFHLNYKDFYPCFFDVFKTINHSLKMMFFKKNVDMTFTQGQQLFEILLMSYNPPMSLYKFVRSMAIKMTFKEMNFRLVDVFKMLELIPLIFIIVQEYVLLGLLSILNVIFFFKNT